MAENFRKFDRQSQVSFDHNTSVFFSIMAQSKDGIQGLERNRARLEENVRKLKASLNRWQAWEIEYEGLKEDVLGLRHDASPIKLVNKLLEEIYDAPFNTVKETLENFETSLPIDNGELSLTPNGGHCVRWWSESNCCREERNHSR